jgi:hypothetical protein
MRTWARCVHHVATFGETKITRHAHGDASMSALDRLRLWFVRRRSLHLTLGAIPLPSLIPDARVALKDIYDRHRKRGYKVYVFWDVLILDANAKTYRMQFYPVMSSPQECLAVGLRGRHMVRFVPLVADTEELDRLYKGLLAKRTFEQEFKTDPMLMSPQVIEQLDRTLRKRGPIKGG